MPSDKPTEVRTRDDYTVGWICPLEIEQIAALEMLDKEHERLPQPSTDHNVYNLGSIAGHNIVIAGLHTPGNTPAATVVTQMRMTFPNLRFGLLVGIGGGVPVRSDNGMIRLGHVVVSKPTGAHSGAVQYDHGKAKSGSFERTGALAPPPAVLLNAAQDLAVKRARSLQDPIAKNIQRINTNIRGLKKYKHPGRAQDYLYPPEYNHVKAGVSCSECGCDPSKRIQRQEDNDDDDDESYVVVHRGNVASGELVVKDANLRDMLAREHGLFCFDTEAAGVLADFPCLIIRGISDYCDSHRNDIWQGYSTVAAAAYARQLFFHMPVEEVKRCISQSTERNIESITYWQNKKENREILDWITPFDYGPQHSDYLQARQLGTGLWLLNHEVYQKWLGKTEQTLFCPGIPGAGKTILSAIVIDNLERKFIGDMNTAVAYIYCNFNRKTEQSTQELLCSLLKQLTQCGPSVPQTVRDLYDLHYKKRTKPTLEEISNTLKSVAATYPKVFIVVDALDECQSPDRKRFLLELFKVQAKAKLNIFATSRPIPEVQDIFKDSLIVEVRANSDDIRHYLDERMSQLPDSVAEMCDFKTEIINSITQGVDGMFLLAKLHFDSLVGQDTVKKIRKSLQKLETESNYDITYQSAMERIEGQVQSRAERAKQVLAWITYAERQLTTLELQHALAIELGESHLDRENIPEVEYLVSVCAGLVTIDQQSNIIRLVHYTTQQYFERTRDHWFPNAQSDITNLCITYLAFDIFEFGMCDNRKEFKERLNSYPFYDYASHYWGYHARSTSDYQSILNFFKMQHKIDAATQALLTSMKQMNFYHFTQDIPRQMTGFHLTALFGLHGVMRAMIDSQDLHKRNSVGRTPLSISAENGYEILVCLLLEKGAKANTYDILGRTPLSFAAQSGHNSVARLLLEKGANIDSGSRTPLSFAAQGGHEFVVRLLLERRAKADSKDPKGRTPLSFAAEGGYESVVQLLLDHGAKVDPKCTFVFHKNMTPLLFAALRGHKSVVQLLLMKGANADWENAEGRTPLFFAAQKGHEDMVRLLLEKEVDVNRKDIAGRTPLIVAAQGGHESVIRLLLVKGADADCNPVRGSTPLSLAAQGGHESIVRFLLEKGADADWKDYEGRTPLAFAAEGGHEPIVRFLLEIGVEPDSKATCYHLEGCTPLTFAAREGHESVVRLLLEKGADADTKSKFYTPYDRTPLSFAADQGHETLVQLLLEEGANADWKDSEGRNPLSFAAENGHESVVRLLLERRANADSNDTEGSTPLSFAANEGHESMARLLLGEGAEADSRNCHGRTPLSFAARGGHESMVRLLLGKGAEADSKNCAGRTPLSFAAQGGHESMVRLLLGKGVEADSKNCEGRTPLSFAAQGGHKSVVQLLLEADTEADSKDSDGNTPLSFAARGGHDSVVLVLLEKGAEVDSKHSEGRTPLSFACEGGYQSVVRLLLDRGAEFDLKDIGGRTPLSFAAQRGHEFMVRLLLEKGAEVDSNDFEGRTPLSFVTHYNGRNITRLLLENGAEADSKDSKGRTPLSFAAQHGQPGVMWQLLKKGADIDSTDSNGRTPLSYAAGMEHMFMERRFMERRSMACMSMVQLLLANGADADTKDSEGRTPLSFAAGEGHGSVVLLLLEKGTEVDSKDFKGRTPLSFAAQSGHQSVVELLLKKGANAESKNSEGKTPISFAAENGHKSLEQLLLQAADAPLHGNTSENTLP